ncbi:MAG: PorP/SprF family type IX secretion system membrane protein [Flavobacteriaceae bacterium]|nr:PorP/SprF family type IX secretion system membrane protein [Flavobacteriaceae bacterium]
MFNKNIYIVFFLFSFTFSLVGQDVILKNQSKILGTLNPSFFGFGETTKVGVNYGLEIIDNKNTIENKMAFANYYFEDYNFSLGADVSLIDIGNLGYSSSQLNLHYIYNSRFSYNWVFNPSITVGLGSRNLDFKSLIFEDQINVYTGNISGISNDRVAEGDNVLFFDVGAGLLFHNSQNFFVGFNAKHINKPETSFNSEATNKKDLFMSLQSGYEIDLNPWDRRNLPSNSFLFLFGAYSIENTSSRLDLSQEVLIENISFGINQQINNYKDISFTTFGASLGFLMTQIEIGVNYSFEIGNKQTFAKQYNTLEIFLTFDLNSFDDRFGGNSRFKNY